MEEKSNIVLKIEWIYFNNIRYYEATLPDNKCLLNKNLEYLIRDIKKHFKKDSYCYKKMLLAEN